MKLYYENITEEEKISLDFPLDACVEQALEVFENLPQSDGSSFGLVDENDGVIHFEKFNKFMWLVQFLNFQNTALIKRFVTSINVKINQRFVQWC